MVNYFACSKFMDWVRKRLFGIDKPKTFPMEWDDNGDLKHTWKDNLKRDRPIAFFFTEDIPDYIDDFRRFVRGIWSKPYNYCYNRFVSRTHLLDTGLSKGQWHELDDRILHACFNSFVKFVEGEQAYCFKGKEYRKTTPPKLAAMNHFDWACNLRWSEDELSEGNPKIGQLTPQALSAIEQKKLWLWWTEERPKRVDPYHGPLTKDKYRNAFKLEQEYIQEDTEMLIRLMKIRTHLWS